MGSFEIQHPGFAFVQALSPCPTFRPEQMEWKHQVRGFEAATTSDPTTAAQRIQEDDGMSTGIIYRSQYPVYRFGDHGSNGDVGGVVGGGAGGIGDALSVIESEFRI